MKKSRLVTASDLEKLLSELERQHKKIEQSKLEASGYRNLSDAKAISQAVDAAASVFNRSVLPHEKTLKQTQEIARRTVDRLIRAKTVPKADIDLVRAIESRCAAQRKAWATASQSGRQSFESQLKDIATKETQEKRKVEQAVKELVSAMRETKSCPTVPYWLVGKDPRIDSRALGNKCIDAQCKRIQRLLGSTPALADAARSFARFADDYPRKQKRVQIADPKLQKSAPEKFQHQFKAEQLAVTACLSELAQTIKALNRTLERN